MTTTRPDVWLRGPIYGIPELLMPIVQILMQAREDARRAAADLTPDQLRARPGGAASAAYHLFHAAHALDRLMTYARGESLHESQRSVLGIEKSGDVHGDAAELLDLFDATVERAIRQLRCTPEKSLRDERRVGGAQLPSTILGLLFHAAEHTSRHTGQLITTAKVVTGAPR
ncbi:MAG TPA: DinB family protein [Candidatus Krumholzibacteria bacterium]|nr:DinB family protein [Candidatus Krumholzibacteria bacterium]